MTLSKKQKMGIGLAFGALGAIIFSIAMWTNNTSRLSITSSTILIIGGFIFWVFNKPNL